MDRTRNPATQRSLFPPGRDSRQSAMSSISRLWRSNPAPTTSAGSPHAPAKTFVVPLFLSTSRSSARNNLFARGALPATTRSMASTRSVIQTTAPRPGDVRPLSVPRDDRDEVSDMYAGSVQAQTAVAENTEPVPIAQNLDDSPPPSEHPSTRSTQSGSRTTHSSRRSSRKHRTLSEKSFRDPEVNAKAKISFAFGITLLVALVICELSVKTTGSRSGELTNSQTWCLPPQESPEVSCFTWCQFYSSYP